MGKGDNNPMINRREFIQITASLGGAALFTPLLGTLYDTLSKMESNEKVPVAFVKTRERAEGVRRAINLLGINPVKNKRVFLKPNFNSADPAPGSTDNDVLRTLIDELWRMGAKSITLGDRSGMGDTKKVMKKKGIFDMSKELDFEVIVFDELDAKDWVIIQPKESHWKKGFPFARPCLESEVVVQTCCLKTHRFGGHFTMSLKNSIGMVAKYIPGDSYNFMYELHTSPYQRLMIAEVNIASNPDL